MPTTDVATGYSIPGGGIDWNLGLPGSGPALPPPPQNYGTPSKSGIGAILTTFGIDYCAKYFGADLCNATAQALGLVGNGGSGGGATGGAGQGLGAGDPCPTGLVKDPGGSGLCVSPGSPADVSTPAPGSAPGSVQATVVGEINGHPIMKCPPRFVLADPSLFGEGVCFHKNVIPNKLRKWPKAPRAKITAHDWKMMQRYGPGGSKQKRVKEIASAAGFSCKKK